MIWKYFVTVIFITLVRTQTTLSMEYLGQTSTWRLTSALKAWTLYQSEQGFWCIRYLAFVRNKLAFLDAPKRWHYRVGPFILCPYQWLEVCTFHSRVTKSLVGGSCSPFTCFVVNRNNLNSARLELLLWRCLWKMRLHSINAGQRGAKKLLAFAQDTDGSWVRRLNSSVVVLTLNSLGTIWEMIPSVAVIYAAAIYFLCWSYPAFCVASLRDRPVVCISYNMYLLMHHRSLKVAFEMALM